MTRTMKIVAMILGLAVLVAGGEEVRNFASLPNHAQKQTLTGLRGAIQFIRSLFAPPENEAPPISEAVNRFGFELLAEYRLRHPNDNVVFSPVSISAALSLVYFGSAGQTKDELEAVLGFTKGVVPDKLRTKANAVNPNRESVAIANRAFFAEGLQIQNSFVDAVGEVNVQTLNFEQDPDAATNRINGFVADKTRGLIPDMLSDGDVNAATRMVLVNAVYFKGAWKKKFDPKLTRKEEFRGVDGPVQTDFMEFEDEEAELMVKDLPELDSLMVEFPYDDPRFAMYIVLPHLDDGWRFAEEKLLEVDAEFFNTGLFPETLYVSLPKWEQDSVLEDVKDMLVELGLENCFAGADLSRITENDEGLAVSNVVHKARIQVSEEGTEAAAATGGIAARSGYGGEFIVDHPFLYFVIDKSDNTVFFQGTVTKL